MLVPNLTFASLLRSTASIACLLLGLAAAQAETPPLTITSARHSGVAAPAVDDGTVLKRFPASKEELTFRGENATRIWHVALGRTEAARITTIKLAVLNAISVLPERSTIRVVINGIVVGVIPAASPERATATAIKIPSGVLVPGLNTVQITAALTHRVDCSINATYELWASLDPANTGFVVPRDTAFSVRSLDDLAVEPLADDGTTHIHVRLPDDAGPAEISQVGRLVDVLTRRAGLVRPVVDAGPNLGLGAGFDVVIDKGSLQSDAAKDLRIAGRDESITIGRDATTNRLVVILSGSDDDAIDRRLGILSTATAPMGLKPSLSFEGGSSKTLADLGFVTENFAGRHYMSSIDVNLPPDFYPANDRARLLIDGSHAASLAAGSQLVFRVNGTLVSSMPLASGKSEILQHAVVELPLRFFHPGHNDLAIEGTTSSYFDEQCYLNSMPHDARVSIIGTSELEFPDFAHLATLPQINTALAYDSSADAALNLYLPDTDRGSIGAGLTVLANMAAHADVVGVPRVHIGTPAGSDMPGIVIAAIDQLPESINSALRRVTVPVSEVQGSENDRAATSRTEPTPASADPLGEAAAANSARLAVTSRSALASAESYLRGRGFFFASDRHVDTLPVTGSSILIAAVPPELAFRTVGGVELPQFVRHPAHWLVVTGPNADVYQAGLQRLVADGHWKNLSGQAISLDLKTDEFRTAQPSRISYVVPSRVVIADLRPILGGIVSNNIVVSIALMMVMMSALGVSTHLLIRRMGAK